MPSSLMVVLIELWFFTKNAVDIRPYFLTFPNGTLYQGTIILLMRSTSNFGEEVCMPPTEVRNRHGLLRRRFARMEVNIPGVIHVFGLVMFFCLWWTVIIKKR